MSSDSFISSPALSLTFIHANGFILICMWTASRAMFQSNIHFNWGRLISALMNSRVPWLFPYFGRRRGLNLSAGICAGDDHAHLKENNTLPPKHLAPAQAWASLQSSPSRFGSRAKTEVGYSSQIWTGSYVEPHLRQQSEAKHRLCNVMTVELSHLPGWKRRTEPIRWKRTLSDMKITVNADSDIWTCAFWCLRQLLACRSCGRIDEGLLFFITHAVVWGRTSLAFIRFFPSAILWCHMIRCCCCTSTRVASGIHGKMP